MSNASNGKHDIVAPHQVEKEKKKQSEGERGKSRLTPIHSVAASAPMIFSEKCPIFLLSNAFCLRVVGVRRAVEFGPQLQFFIGCKAFTGLCPKADTSAQS